VILREIKICRKLFSAVAKVSHSQYTEPSDTRAASEITGKHMKSKVYAWKRRNIAYLSIPKAACSSIKWSMFEARKLPLPEYWWQIHKSPWPEEMSLAEVRGSGLDTLCVVRHPIHRTTSLYRSKMNPDEIGDLSTDHPEIRLGMSFREFVDFVCSTKDERCNDHLASQTWLLSDDKGIVPKHPIRLERLQAEWPRIASAYRLPRLPVLNQQGSRKNAAGETVASADANPTTSQVSRLLWRYREDVKFFRFRA
jgi:hypothetical protein